MVLRKFPVYSFLSRRHGVKGKKKEKNSLPSFCVRDVPTPCAELPRFLPETAIFWVLVLLISPLDIVCLQHPIGRLISVLAVCGQPYM